MTKPMSTTFLEVDNISNGESGTSEVTAFLLNPSPLLSTAETTGNTVTDNLSRSGHHGWEQREQSH